MTKPVIVTMSRGNPDDLVEIIDDNGEKTQRMGLCKHVEQSYLSKTFNDLFSYMVDPDGDELNKPYTQSEIELASAIQNMKSAGDVILIPRIDGEFNNDTHISLDSRVSEYSNQIIERKELNIKGDTIPYESIDLKVRGSFFGG